MKLLVKRWGLIRPLGFALFNLSAFFFIGCGSAVNDSREHLPIYGQITQNASPVGDGVIAFIPTKENTAGSPASTNILAGEYRFTSTDGPSTGEYRVRINSLPPSKSDLFVEKPNSISGGPWEFELDVTEALTADGADFELSDETRKVQ